MADRRITFIFERVVLGTPSRITKFFNRSEILEWDARALKNIAKFAAKDDLAMTLTINGAKPTVCFVNFPRPCPAPFPAALLPPFNYAPHPPSQATHFDGWDDVLIAIQEELRLPGPSGPGTKVKEFELRDTTALNFAPAGPSSSSSSSSSSSGNKRKKTDEKADEKAAKPSASTSFVDSGGEGCTAAILSKQRTALYISSPIISHP